MNNEETIYEVVLTYKAEMRGGSAFYCNLTTSVTVRGAAERDKLIDVLKTQGFNPEWHYLNAPNALGALQRLAKGFAEWPPVKENADGS